MKCDCCEAEGNLMSVLCVVYNDNDGAAIFLCRECVAKALEVLKERREEMKEAPKVRE